MKAKPSKASSASRPAACNCWACAQHQLKSVRRFARTVAATGTLAFDERRLAVVTTKVEGWIEQLDVAATGEAVKRPGAGLAYSPLLVSAEEEYLLAAHMPASHGGSSLGAAALQRLRALDVPEDENRAPAPHRQGTRRIAIRAPADASSPTSLSSPASALMPASCFTSSPISRASGLSAGSAGKRPWPDPAGRGRARQHGRVSRPHLRRYGRFHLPDAERRHAHGQGAHRHANPISPCARDVCSVEIAVAASRARCSRCRTRPSSIAARGKWC